MLDRSLLIIFYVRKLAKNYVLVLFIKTSSIKAVPEYGIQNVPSVVLFMKGIPVECPVSLLEEEGVRDWALKKAGRLFTKFDR